MKYRAGGRRSAEVADFSRWSPVCGDGPCRNRSQSDGMHPQAIPRGKTRCSCTRCRDSSPLDLFGDFQPLAIAAHQTVEWHRWSGRHGEGPSANVIALQVIAGDHRAHEVCCHLIIRGLAPIAVLSALSCTEIGRMLLCGHRIGERRERFH